MKKLISEFPDNIKEALNIANSVNLSKPNREIHNVVICGMGGSGIGGKLVSKWLEEELKVAVIHVHDYTMPEFVSYNSLVIASSYSGNTEETISAIEEANKKGAYIIGICSGGELKSFCQVKGFDFIEVPGGNPPRTALAFSITQLINVFVQFEMVSPDRMIELEASRRLIIENELEIKDKAKELARFLNGNIAVLYGATKYEPVLIRARQQFNENSKMLCWHHVLPEMNHNELVGWGGGDNRFAVVFFETQDIHPRNARRLSITKEVIGKYTNKLMSVVSAGNSTIERSIYMINVVDWASFYLSELKKVDPIDIAVIDMLKNELAAFN